ncbi:MAG: hypothetical protein QM484_08465 [Woeseiaceae bacterium]
MTIEDTCQETWPQIKEMILMLSVAVARIDHAMTEGDESFTALSLSFIETKGSANNIVEIAEEIEDDELKNKLLVNCNDITNRVNNSIMSFQFYDKLSQRMDLVSKTLTEINVVLQDKERTNDSAVWLELQEKIRSKYTLDADQEMFDAVISGMPIAEALKIAVKKTTENEVEFF